MSNVVLSWITWIILFCICHDRIAQARIHYIFMTNYCSMTFNVDDSVILALTYDEKLLPNRDSDFIHCDVDLLAPKGVKLFVHFIQLSISPSIDHSDRLHIFDLTANNTRLTPVKGLYGKLDRTLSLFDKSGTQINDYRSIGNEIRLDYLGKPTVKSPGFRILVTSFQEPTSGGSCPDNKYLCKRSRICIPVDVLCDGKPNCGTSDDSDEKGCDRSDTVTNLLAEYSLTRDIIVVVLLPLAIFIGFVVAAFICAQRYIRLKLNTFDLPTVHFTPKKDGIVRIAEECSSCAPPSYEDTLSKRYEPPPAYHGLSNPIIQHCSNSAEPQNETALNNVESKSYTKGLHLETELTHCSMSLMDNKEGSLKTHMQPSDYENYRLHCVWPSDTDDDEEIKEKRRRKGGRCKGKGNRKERIKLEQKRNEMTSTASLENTCNPSSGGEPSSPGASSVDACINCESCSPTNSSSSTDVSHEPSSKPTQEIEDNYIKPKDTS